MDIGFSNREVINELDKRSLCGRTDVESKWNGFMREEERRNWKQREEITLFGKFS